jgi:NADH pyrophosphatase NudC (nudix superfamily)
MTVTWTRTAMEFHARGQVSGIKVMRGPRLDRVTDSRLSSQVDVNGDPSCCSYSCSLPYHPRHRTSGSVTQSVSLFNNKPTRLDRKCGCGGESGVMDVNEGESSQTYQNQHYYPSIFPCIIVPLCSSSPRVIAPSILSSPTNSRSGSL